MVPRMTSTVAPAMAEHAFPERIDVGVTPRDHNEEEHRARYVWAADRVQGRVLDIACGTGHGSAVLSRCAEVVGMDKEPSAVAGAAARVASGRFEVASVPPIPAETGAFD